MVQRNKLTAAVLLAALLVSLVVPTAAAGSGGSQESPAGSPVRLLSSAAAGVTFDVAVPWQLLELESVTVAGKAYLRVSLPGWSSDADAGLPELPVLAEAVGAPQGADVSVRVIPGLAHAVPLSAPPLPAAAQVVDPAVPATPAAALLPQPRTVIAEDPAVYTGSAAHPFTLARITNDGLVRQQRVVGLAVFPVQYRPRLQELTVYESLRIVVTFGDTPSETRGPAPEDSAAYESFFAQQLLNYDVARRWRQPAGQPAGQPAAGEDSVTAAPGWAPPVPAWRIKVRADGFYRLTYDALRDKGLPVTTLDPHTLQVFRSGSEVASYEEGDGDASFEAGESLVFYGEAAPSKYTLDNVYWLTYGKMTGQRMSARDGAPAAGNAESAYTEQLHVETNTYYIPKTPGDENQERWLWDYLQPPGRPSWTYTFSLPAAQAGSATLRVALLGYLANAAVNPDHHARISMNGAEQDVWWDGITWKIVEMPVTVVAGDNTVTVVCPNDTGLGYDVVYVDWVELAYPSSFVADGNELSFTYATVGSRKFQVSGFSTTQIALYDVTNPYAVERITGFTTSGTGPYSAAFQDSVSASTDYWAMTSAAYRTPLPDDIEADAASNLGSTANGADHIIITHKAFASQATQLRNHRAAQGLRALVVDVHDIYDEFSYGVTGAAAIHDFLAYAYTNWQAPAPSYVLLLGDGTYDPNNYLGYGVDVRRTSYIPPYLAPVDPGIGETAADNRYVTLSGSDTFPDMMLGRLAVNSTTAAGPAEAAAFVNKIIGYEQAPAYADWKLRVLAIADNADSAGNFPKMSDTLLNSYLPPPYQAQKVHYGVTHTTSAAARAAIQQGINNGALIVNYIGHASNISWAYENLLNVADIPLLTNSSALPVFLPMTCYDGYYHHPYPLADGQDALGEIVTRADGRGAVASWSPTGVGLATGHDSLDQGFFEAVFLSGQRRLGQATTAGKLKLWATGVNRDLIDTYVLFGDPATWLGGECAAPASAVKDVQISVQDATHARLDWPAVPAALQYQVWWSAANPYFVPVAGTACSAANGCAVTAGTTISRTGLGDERVNYTYVVRPVAWCGAVQNALSNRTGEFDFQLVESEPTH